MRILAASRLRPGIVDAGLAKLIRAVDASLLRGWVQWISVPRHRLVNSVENREAGDWIHAEFERRGYEVSFQGKYRNVVAVAMNQALQCARDYLPAFPVHGVKVILGLEKFFPVLQRSDHAPFWSAGIPSVMCTDTSEFRNLNYHQETDTPDSLDYEFLADVTRVLIATVIAQAVEMR